MRKSRTDSRLQELGAGPLNPQKEWAEQMLRRAWKRACESAGEDIALQEGTGHSMLSALSEVLPERMLRKQSRHQDARSLDRYSVGGKPDTAALVPRIRPRPARGPSEGS